MINYLNTANLIKISIFLMLITIIPQTAKSAPNKRQRIAILEFSNQAQLTEQESQYLSDLVRSEIRQLLSTSSFIIMTRENILDLLPPDSNMSECLGECAIETGRNLGADFVITGNIVEYGNQYRVSLSLHETEVGNLLSSKHCGGTSLMDLESSIPHTAKELLRESSMAIVFVLPEDSENAPIWSTNRIASAIVMFESDPPGAAVEINGIPSCTTAGSRALKPGRYEITMKKLRYFSRTEFIDVTPEGALIKWKLDPNYGWLSIDSNPIGLPVFIDGQQVGKTPITDFEKDAGTYVISVDHEGYHSLKEEIIVEIGSHHQIHLEPTPRNGAIILNAHDRSGDALEADVFIDGRLKGKAFSPITLITGEYDVLVKGQFLKWSGRIKIEEGTTRDLHILLEDPIISDKIRTNAQFEHQQIKTKLEKSAKKWMIGAAWCAGAGFLASAIEPKRTDSFEFESGYENDWTPELQEDVTKISLIGAGICGVIALGHIISIPSENSVLERLMDDQASIRVDMAPDTGMTLSYAIKF